MALTEKDLRAIGDLISEKIQTLPRREEVKTMIAEAIEGLASQEEIRRLPSKEEFFSAMDQIMGDLQAIRQEQTMGAGRLREHEDRITSLEDSHPGGKHAH